MSDGSDAEEGEIDCGICFERHAGPKPKRRKLNVPSPPHVPRVTERECFIDSEEVAKRLKKKGVVAAAQGEKSKPKLRVPSPPAVPKVSQREAATDTGRNGDGYLDVYGAEAHPSVDIRPTGAIRIADVQALILWILAEGHNPSWAFVKNKPLLERVLVLMVPGIDRALFEARKDILVNMHTLLGSPVMVYAKNAQCYPGQTVTALFSVPHDKKRKREEAERQEQQRQQQDAESPQKLPLPVEHYVLSRKDMEMHGFPLAFIDDDGEMQCPEGFVSSATPGIRASTGYDNIREMVALDCEMCICDESMEVTRVTLLDRDGQVLMDDLVKPDVPITDYNTRYSGITAEMLAPVTRTLADAQKTLFSYMGPETYLVGHALENDLAAMRVLHARCIDTAALFPHPRVPVCIPCKQPFTECSTSYMQCRVWLVTLFLQGPPYKFALKMLTYKYLKRTIQLGSHDSVDDAKAALDLAKLKFRHGPACGVEPLAAADRLCDVLASHKRRATLVDRIEVLNRHTTGTASAIKVAGDSDAAAKAGRAISQPGVNFVWTQFSQLSDLYERRARCKAEPAPPGEPPPPGGPAAVVAANPQLAREQAKHAQHAAAGEATGDPLSDLRSRAEARLRAAGASPASSGGGGSGTREGTPSAVDSLPAAAAAAAVVPGAAQEVPDSALKRLDGLIGQLYASLPPDTLLMVYTGQGDTAECRRLQREKFRRQQCLDGLPPWNMESEARFNEFCSRVSRALCFCVVKQ